MQNDMARHRIDAWLGSAIITLSDELARNPYSVWQPGTKNNGRAQRAKNLRTMAERLDYWAKVLTR